MKRIMFVCHVFIFSSSVVFGAELNILGSSQLASGTLSIKGSLPFDYGFSLQDLDEEGIKQGICALVAPVVPNEGFVECMKMCAKHIAGLDHNEELDDYSEVLAAEMEHFFPEASALLMAVYQGRLVCVKRVNTAQSIISGQAIEDHEESLADAENLLLSWESNH